MWDTGEAQARVNSFRNATHMRDKPLPRIQRKKERRFTRIPQIVFPGFEPFTQRDIRFPADFRNLSAIGFGIELEECETHQILKRRLSLSGIRIGGCYTR